MQTLNKCGIINYRNVTVETKSGQNIDTEIYLVDRARLVQCNIRDITEHKKTQEALRASEELFRNYLEYAPDGVYMSDVKGNFLYGNRKCEEIIGYRREELIGKNFLELNLLPEKSLNKAAQLLQANMKGKPTGPDEIELISKEGRLIPVEISTSVVQRMGEGIVLAFVRDVTERKRVEETLVKSEGRYREFFSTSRDCVFITSMEGKWIDFNDIALEMFGYDSREELFQIPISSLYVNLEERSMLLALIEKQGYVKEHPVLLRRRDGAVIDALITTGFRQNTDGFEKEYYGTIRDITVHKQAVEALKESENKYRLLADNVHDVIFVLDMNLKYTYVSPSVKILRGYEPEEVMKQPPSEILTLSSLDLAMKTLAEALELEKTEHRKINISQALQLEMMRKDGTTVWTEVNFSAIRDENKQPVGILGVTRDITERKQADDVLRESEDQYRLVVENAKESIIIVQDMKVVFVNRATIGMLGYSKEILTSKSFTDFIHPDDLNMVADHHIRRIKGEEVPPVYSFRVIGQDGTVIWCEINAAVIQWKGKPATLNFLNNISERKRADEELKESENKYRLLADNVDDVIFVLDMNLKFTYVSPSVKILMGYEQEELLKLRASETMTPSSWDLTTKNLSKELEKFEQGDSTKLQFLLLEMRRKDGSTVWTELKASFIRDENHRPMGIIGVSRDITERKRADEALSESEEKYLTILKDMDDVYFEVDIKGNIAFVNFSACKMSGYSEEELLGMLFKKISAPDDIEKVMQYFGEIFLTGTTGKPFLWNLVKKNGEQGFFEIVVSLIRDKQGKPIGFRGIGRDITERKKAETELQQTLESFRKAVGATIQVMVSAVEMRDPYTAGHQIRVADLARTIATEMGLPKEKIDGIRMAGSIHDIGKLSIPAELLSKPTKLTSIEFSLIKEHSHSGYEMLKDVESPWPLAQIVYQHHERMDGSGYPRNLKGDEILIEARIMAVADVVEAMASHRPYRPGLGIDAALAEIEKNKGIFYDNTVADACLRLFREKGYQLT
jgi:PAS domain S-box-containing protein